MLEASTAAELESFDDADFHDSIQRARKNADQYASQVVWGFISLITTAVSSVAVGAVLLSVAPVLLFQNAAEYYFRAQANINSLSIPGITACPLVQV